MSYITEEAKYVSSEEGIKNLASAIIMQACKDYSEGNFRDRQSIERWLLDPKNIWVSSLDVEPERLLYGFKVYDRRIHRKINKAKRG